MTKDKKMWASKNISIIVVLSMIVAAILPLTAGDPLYEITSGEGDSGAGTTAQFGWNVSKAGDVDSDGTPDIIVGAPNADYGGNTDCGAAFIFFGYEGIEDGDLNASSANVSIYGANAGDHFGWDVSDAGDVNGNYADIIIGAPDALTYGTDRNGSAYIFYGKGLNWEAVTDDGVWALSSTAANVTIDGEADGDRFGASVSGAGNYDNSGSDDVIIGAPNVDSGKGGAYVFYDGSMSASISAGNADVILNGKHTDGKFGSSVSSAGDTDGVGGTEVVVSEPGSELAYVYYPPSDQTANADVPVFGTVTNTYTNTQSQNDQHEHIKEISATGSTVQVGSGTDGLNYPFRTDLANTRTQIVYTSAEIGTSGYIDKVHFHRSGVSATGTAGNLKIYICDTSLTAMGTDMVANYDGNTRTLVYDQNNVDLFGADNTWIIFDITDYYYANTESVIVEFYLSSSSGGPIYANSFIYAGAKSYNADQTDTGSVSTYKPNCKFEFADVPSKLEHKWTINIPERSNCAFYVEANHTSNTEGDDFDFYYSLTGSGDVGDIGWTQIVTITKTSDNDQYQYYSDTTFSDFAGTIYIGVKDQDRSAGNTVLDILSIDHMFVRAIVFKELVGERITQNTDYTATADTAVTGTVTNTYAKTQATDDDYESIQEISVAATYDYDYTSNEWFTQSDSHTNDHTATQAQGGNTEDIVEKSLPGGGTEYLYVDSWGSERTAWTEVGAAPYLDAQDQPTNIIRTTSDGAQSGDYTFQDSTITGTFSSSQVGFYANNDDGAGNDDFDVWIYDGSVWTLVGTPNIAGTTWAWYTLDTSAILDTQAKIDAAKLYVEFNRVGQVDDVRIDCARIYWETSGTAHYSLEQKWQFTDTPLSASQYEFHAFVGWDGAGAGDDTFEYYYSEANPPTTSVGDPSEWTLMFTDTTSAVNEQTFDLDNDGYTGGTFYVGVIDTASSGDGQDTLIVDYLYVETTVTPATSKLEHKWTFSGVTAGTDTTFYLEAYRTDLDSEDFEFYYSTTGAGDVDTWTKMLDLTKTTDDDAYQTYSDATLDAFTGTLYVGVIDATIGDSNLDTVYIDHMYFRASGAILPSDFGFSVSNVGNLNDDGSGLSDIAITDPTGNNGYTYIWEDGNFEGSSSRTDTSQADFTASGSSLASSNPNNDVYATSTGDVNLTSTLNYYIDDDFESNDVGVNPAGWTCQATSYTSVVSTPTHSGTRSVEHTDSSAAFAAFKSQIFTAQTTVTVEFWIYYTVTGQQYNLLLMDNAQADVVTQVAWLSGNVYYFYDGGSNADIGDYATGTWQHIKVVCDSDTDKLDIYIDDMVTPAVSQGNFNYVTNDIGFIQFATMAAGTGTFYIDDVQVYTGGYSSPGYYESSTTTASGYITAVKPYWNITTPTDTTAWINISRDGGITWNQSAITNGYWYTFPSGGVGKELCYKVEMSTTNTGLTPVLEDITLYYRYCNPPDVTFTGASSGDKFGFSLSNAGDIDGDSIDDLIVGAPYNDDGGADAGGIFIYCGGSYLSGTVSAANANFTYFGENAGDMLGWSVGAAGDINKHGYDDVVAGAPYFASSDGAAYALSIALPMKITSFTVEEHGSEPLKVNLTWTGINGAAKYKIYRNMTGKLWEFDFDNPIATVDAPGTSWTDNNAPRNTSNPHNATVYYYAVRAENAIGELGPYNVFAIYRLDLVLGWNLVPWFALDTQDIETEAFKNLEADDGTNPDTYEYDKVERWNPSSQEWESYTTDGDLGPFSDMEPGYAYAVQCSKSCLWTYTEDCGTPSLSTANDASLSAPGNFALARNAVDPNHIDLSWDVVAAADHYNIYRSTTRWGFDFNSPIYTTANNAEVTWTDTTSTQENGAYNHSVYYYVVRAVDASGDIEKNWNVAGMHRMDFRENINYITWSVWESEDIDTSALASLNWGLALPNDYIQVLLWNDSAQDWNYSMPSIVEDFTTFDPGYGYAIYTLQACTWTYVEYA